MHMDGHNMNIQNSLHIVVFYQIITHKDYKMRKGVKTVPEILLLHTWRSAVKKRQFRCFYRTVMGNIALMMRRTRYASAFVLLSRILQHHVIFGSCRRLWSMLCSYINWTAPEFGWTRGLLVWCTPKFGWWCSH